MMVAMTVKWVATAICHITRVNENGEEWNLIMHSHNQSLQCY